MAEVQYKFGYIPSKRDHKDWIYGQVINITASDIPTRVMNDRVPILNQGDEGSCTGHGGSYHKEMQERPSHNGQAIQFSRRFLYQLARLIDGLPDDQEGSTPKAIMQVLQQYGVCLESTLPYVTHQTPTITDVMYKEALNYRIKNYAQVKTVDEIKHAIALGKTVLSGVIVTDTFMFPEIGGFVGLPQGKLYGGHCINLDGYDDNMTHTFANGKTLTGFIRFVNSWGENWGDKGYGYIPYEFFTLQSDMGYYYFMEGWTSVDLDSDPVPPTPLPQPAPSAKTIELYIDSTKAYVDSVAVTLDIAPEIKNDLTLVPLRFVGENMGYSVEWNNDLRKVTLKKLV